MQDALLTQLQRQLAPKTEAESSEDSLRKELADLRGQFTGLASRFQLLEDQQSTAQVLGALVQDKT